LGLLAFLFINLMDCVKIEVVGNWVSDVLPTIRVVMGALTGTGATNWRVSVLPINDLLNTENMIAMGSVNYSLSVQGDR
jgi:hypothetical protein